MKRHLGRPIRPEELSRAIEINIPQEVYDAINDLLRKQMKDGECVVIYLADLETLMSDLPFNSLWVAECVDSYRAVGWKVTSSSDRFFFEK